LGSAHIRSKQNRGQVHAAAAVDKPMQHHRQNPLGSDIIFLSYTICVHHTSVPHFYSVCVRPPTLLFSSLLFVYSFLFSAWLHPYVISISTVEGYQLVATSFLSEDLRSLPHPTTICDKNGAIDL
jgi:hypothetical protein